MLSPSLFTGTQCYSHHMHTLLLSSHAHTATLITCTRCYSHHMHTLLLLSHAHAATLITCTRCYSHHMHTLLLPSHAHTATLITCYQGMHSSTGNPQSVDLSSNYRTCVAESTLQTSTLQSCHVSFPQPWMPALILTVNVIMLALSASNLYHLPIENSYLKDTIIGEHLI